MPRPHLFLMVIDGKTNKVKEVWIFPDIERYARRRKLKNYDKALFAQHDRLLKKYPLSRYDVVFGMIGEKSPRIALKKVFSDVTGWNTAAWHEEALPPSPTKKNNK